MTTGGDWGGYYDYSKEWESAQYLLNIPKAGIPFSVTGGNHDNGSATNRGTGGVDISNGWQYFNQYFGIDNFSNYPWYKGYCSIGNNSNTGGNANNWEEFVA